MNTVAEIQRLYSQVRDVEGVLRRADFFPEGFDEEGTPFYSIEAVAFVADLNDELKAARDNANFR